MIRILYVGAIKKNRFISEAIKAISNTDCSLLIKGRDDGHLSGCSFMLCMYNPSVKNNRYGMPNKLYLALKFGMPVIVSDNTDAAEFVKKYRCGIVCEYDYSAFTEMLKNIHKYPLVLGSTNARTAYKTYNWGNDKKELEKIYKRSTLK